MKKHDEIQVVILITVCTVFGKALGIFRDILISNYYGATQETDAFFLALSIPTIILGVFTASTDSAIIPQYKRVMAQNSKLVADNLFSKIVNSLSLIAILSGLVIFLLPNYFIKVFATGFNQNTSEIATRYLRIFSPIGFFHLLYCFFCTYNAAHRKNIVRSILAFLNNMILVLVLLFTGSTGLVYIAFAYFLVNVLCAFLPLIEMSRLGYIHKFKTYDTHGEYGKFIIIFFPIMGGALLNDIQQYVDKNLSSSIEGGISYLNYGDKLVNVFDSILVVGLGVVILPLLSDLENEKDYQKMSRVSSKVTRMMLVLLIPCMIVLISSSKELITLLFGRGKFDAKAIENVTLVLLAYAPLIVITPLITIFSKFFYVKEMSDFPFKINFFGVVLNTVLSILLKIKFGVVGVASATTISMLVETFAYVIFIEKYVKWDRKELQFRHYLGMLLPTLISLFAVFCIPLKLDLILQIATKSVFIGCIFLLFYCVFLKEDVVFFVVRLKRR